MLISKVSFALVCNFLIFGSLLFLPAGTLDWWRAWIFLGVVSLLTIATVVGVFRDNEGLWEERLKPPIQPEQPSVDRIIVSLFIIAFFGSIAFIPLDVFRFHLLPEPNALVSGLGLLLFVAGWGIISFSLKENPFAAPVVKHQVERHQTVIDTGVYSAVRHPMYAGALGVSLGIPLWLGSTAGAMLAVIPIGILAIRVIFEEQFLRRELKDYDAYTERVRFRLLPYLW